jgi:hypothetical protein
MKNLLIVIAVFLNGCATGYKVEKIDASITPKGQIGSKTLGLNGNNELILQEEQTAADELRIQEAVNMHLLMGYEQDAFDLKRCRTEVSDPRLGGSGVIPPIDEIDSMKTPETVKEEIGLTSDGEVKIVRKSYFTDKLKLERSYERSLRKMISVVSRHKEECEYKMAIARRAAGLPSSRFQGEGYFTNGGVFVQTNQNENSLDDAFEIAAKRKR